MSIDIENLDGNEPLGDYPWRPEVDRLLVWLQDKNPHFRAFCFDLVMSAAYIDATPGIEKKIERCDSTGGGYNSHVGFISLCSPCYLNKKTWSYQKAVKPQSGVLGKLSSEIILRFVEKLYPRLSSVSVVGGAQPVDAMLVHQNGEVILAEVKSAPLLTYPIIFKAPKSCLRGQHEKLVITGSQLRNSESAIFLHKIGVIGLGKVGDEMWPFKGLVDFCVNEGNASLVESCVREWVSAKEAYARRNTDDEMYYLANASGSPPVIARSRDGWPQGQTISDSKTSAGMDRTDDIKKGIYQTLKVGVSTRGMPSYRTAIVSNLPAYRHGDEYVAPFVDMLWGMDGDLTEGQPEGYMVASKLRRAFDYIITLEEPILRGTEL